MLVVVGIVVVGNATSQLSVVMTELATPLVAESPSQVSCKELIARYRPTHRGSTLQCARQLQRNALTEVIFAGAAMLNRTKSGSVALAQLKPPAADDVKAKLARSLQLVTLGSFPGLGVVED